MNVKTSLFHRSYFIALLSFAIATVYAAGPNLVPEKPAKRSPHYWCTWYAQNYWMQRGGEITDFSRLTNQNAREQLAAHTVFNKKDGWAAIYLPRGRSDFTFLIDHGWQVKRGEGDLAGGIPFFNMLIDTSDFPKYAGLSPQEALRMFNDDIQSLGWRALGLWVRGTVSTELAERYVKWSQYAGITYWKIDGGDYQYRTWKAKEKLYPELILEHAKPPGHFNGPAADPNAADYPSTFAEGHRMAGTVKELLKNTDVVRTYDVAPHLITPTTLRRVHDILSQTAGDPEYRAILNTQDLPYLSMGLGTALASKRHPNYMERTWQGRDLHHQLEDHRLMQFRMNEVERLGRFSRLALPIPAGYGTYKASKRMFVDSFPHDKWSTWNKWTYGKTLYQNAPAISARNMPLPEVEGDGDLPYVMASAYPSGVTAIATDGRTSPDKPYYVPRVKVMVQIKHAAGPICIAGRYGTLVLKFSESVEKVQNVWAQDLLATSSDDIKDQVKVNGDTITVPGALIDKIGTAAGDKGDRSAPGMVLRLAGDGFVAPRVWIDPN